VSKENSVQERDVGNYLPSLEIPLINSERVPIIKQNVLRKNELIRNMDSRMTVNSFNTQKADTVLPTHKEFATTKKNFLIHRESDFNNSKTPNTNQHTSQEEISNKVLEQWLKSMIELPEEFSLSNNKKNYFKDG